MVMHGELSPLKDLAISAKLGGGIQFCVTGLSSGVFACWLETAKVMVVGFQHPILWVTGKEPQVWALLHLL